MKNRIAKIVSLLDEKKAENIQVFDMRNRDYFVSSVIIATTMGERHGLSLLDYLKDELKKEGEKFVNIDSSEEWSILDLGDMIIHLMTPGYRAKYNIEEFLSNLEEQARKEIEQE